MTFSVTAVNLRSETSPRIVRLPVTKNISSLLAMLSKSKERGIIIQELHYTSEGSESVTVIVDATVSGWDDLMFEHPKTSTMNQVRARIGSVLQIRSLSGQTGFWAKPPSQTWTQAPDFAVNSSPSPSPPSPPTPSPSKPPIQQKKKRIPVQVEPLPAPVPPTFPIPTSFGDAPTYPWSKAVQEPENPAPSPSPVADATAAESVERVPVSAPSQEVPIQPTSSTSSSSNKSSDNSNNSSNSNSGSNNSYTPPQFDSNPQLLTGLLLASTTIASGAWAIDHLCNRIPTRKDHTTDFLQDSTFLTDYINETFEQVGIAVGVTASSAYLTSRFLGPVSKSSFKLRNPLVFLGSLAMTSYLSKQTLETPPSIPHEKYALFLATAFTKGIFLSSTIALSPPILTRLGIYAAGTVASVSYVSATAKSEHYLKIAAPLLTGLTVGSLALFSPLLLPSASLVIPVYQTIWIYVGTGWFTWYVIQDTERMVANGLLVEKGKKSRDVINEALGLYLDVLKAVP
ncbi:hypothetical protein BCR33DRAFT_741112 [Rhizoclosmatium globosum]|uniref:Uncharacterized protein n=1 Tax=Rhizoclosmatium globosum TaxID=329046 RepID=A0A1Y2BW63_9FUNG|nr:hypothetical protein BCR33DRAFT_741112 [Rhizoclosmatium globosum]|eukprot:ORY38999.1 hypothetical protein BCR33DRAFT_741112 [Rhizoclosmatium globosum]